MGCSVMIGSAEEVEAFFDWQLAAGWVRAVFAEGFSARGLRETRALVVRRVPGKLLVNRRCQGACGQHKVDESLLGG